ncbi:MAG TPA: asparagine synthetase B [Candidatus Eisenbacteria bacterium]|nr:asparagine synthetase B [Candidatus Eisenbacteria bacterium]
MRRAQAALAPHSKVALLLALAALLTGALGLPSRASAKILIPMDDKQTDHLRAYGLTYWALERGLHGEWLLNYRGGAFLLPDAAEIASEAVVRGVAVESVDEATVATIMAEIADNNMDVIKLETAPRVAVYVPPFAPPWDDAVQLALDYAQIPYTKLWDAEVLDGKLSDYDWLHLHHEDFTGQYGKFFAAFAATEWYRRQVAENEAMARRFGFGKVSELKKAVARTLKDYVAAGGFLFAMCSATDTIDLALAAKNTDIVGPEYDGDPADRNAQSKLDFSETLAFQKFELEMNPLVYEFSNIDITNRAGLRGERNDTFTLFDFSAKQDPVPTMLVQNHVANVKGFMGQTTGFEKSLIKSGITLLAEVPGSDEVKYIHGHFGKGTFTFYGGHDPEDYQHAVGDPPTDLTLHKHSPGYRLILNNVLFPAAEKKEKKT